MAGYSRITAAIVHITPGFDGSCQLISDAFGTGLRVNGLQAGELASLFRVDQTRPDWARVSERGTISAGLTTDRMLREGSKNALTRSLPGGEVELTSDGPGLARLHGEAFQDQHLLPPPLNLLLSQQWARSGLFPLHAAALRWRDQGVLILGDQGSGKSSLILAALNQGAEIISDDWLLLGAKGAGFRAERLREFLMFRNGPPWDAFGGDLIRLARPGPDGRHVIPIGNLDASPTWIRIDRALLLRTPPDERPGQSGTGAIHQSELLAALAGAAMPLLLTAAFAHERDQLMQRFLALAQRLPNQAGWSGQDLIRAPKTTLDRLLFQEAAR